jgi:CDP-diacylglycerol--serine O-phosphatidyltransferase
MITGSYFIIAAAIFDFFDGFAARALNAYSPIGKDLDSLSDLVSFGVAPSFYAYQVIYLGISYVGNTNVFLIYTSFLLAIFSALRLAKFNIDDSQTKHFIGIPTPITGLMVISLPAFIKLFFNTSLYVNAMNPYIIIFIIVFASFMLIAPIKMMALKFTSYGVKDNFFKYLLLLIALGLFIKYQIASFVAIYFLYIILSLISNLTEKKN